MDRLYNYIRQGERSNRCQCHIVPIIMRTMNGIGTLLSHSAEKCTQNSCIRK